MGISSLTLNQPIQPTKNYIANLTQNSASNGTYYTVLNVTTGKGIVSRLLMAAYQISPASWDGNGNYSFRVTVDGGSALTLSLGNTSSILRGYPVTLTSTTQQSSSSIFLYQTPIYFNKSILIEAMNNNASFVTNVYATVDYALV